MTVDTVPLNPVVGSDPYGYAWSVVTKDQLNDVPKGKNTALGVYAATSIKMDAYFPEKNVDLPIVIEVYANKVGPQPLDTLLTDLLVVVERRLNEDVTLGGLSYDIQVTGESVSVGSQYDNQGSAALYFTVKYNQNRYDPRFGRQ